MKTMNAELKAMNRINGLMTRVNNQLNTLPDDDHDIPGRCTRQRVATWMHSLASTLPSEEQAEATDNEEDSSDE